jgi:hypothetical protein
MACLSLLCTGLLSEAPEATSLQQGNSMEEEDLLCMINPLPDHNSEDLFWEPADFLANRYPANASEVHIFDNAEEQQEDDLMAEDLRPDLPGIPLLFILEIECTSSCCQRCTCFCLLHRIGMHCMVVLFEPSKYSAGEFNEKTPEVIVLEEPSHDGASSRETQPPHPSRSAMVSKVMETLSGAAARRAR